MEVKDHNCTITTEEEESLLLKRLLILKKQLEDDEPKLQPTLYNTKENVVINKNVISSSKFKYRKVNNHNINKTLVTKIDNRNFTNQSKTKENNLSIKTNNTSSKVYSKSNLLPLTPVKPSKKKSETVDKSQNTKKHILKINEIIKNSHVKKCSVLINENYFETCNVSQTLLNIDKYMANVQDYITSSKYIVKKEDKGALSTSQTNNHTKNVHVNRKFQNQLMSDNLLNSNSKSPFNSLISIKKSTSTCKKKSIKKPPEKLIESPNLIKIGNTKLIRQSLFRSKCKINTKPNSVKSVKIAHKPLSTLQCPTPNTLITSNNRSKWTKVTNSTTALKSKLPTASNTNKLKWTRPNILLVDNVNNSYPSVPKSDKLILFGKNKIIRQSLIGSMPKTKNYLLKHLSHRFALLRKLQQKSNIPKVKNKTTSNEQIKNTLLLKKTLNKPNEIKRSEKKSYSMYSYVNPVLRSKINNSYNLEKNALSDIKIPHSPKMSSNKLNNLKIINNDKIQNLSLTKTKALERLRSKKIFVRQLCLVFNRFGICPLLDQGKCDKRHYKKFVTLCTKFLTGECSKDNCTLSHNIVEEKIPFCKHYLNSICVQLNCPYLHEFRDTTSPICTNFLRGYCTLGKKCPKKHLNLCPIFETKNKCPHGQKCLYPHVQCEDINIVDVETNEPRYFEMTIPNNEEPSGNESIHIVPKRHAPLTDLPSYIPLKK